LIYTLCMGFIAAKSDKLQIIAKVNNY